MSTHHPHNTRAGHPCDTPRCSGRRSRGSHSRFCSACRGRIRRYGVVHGRRIHRRELEPYRKQAREFLDSHKETPQVQAAIAVMARYFALCERKNTPGATWVQYVVRADLTPYEALWRSLAVWLLQHWRIHGLTDDKFLTNEFGRAILGARPMPQRVTREGKVTGTREITSTPRIEVGQFLRDNLGVFFLRVEQAIKAGEEQRRQIKATLAVPFAGSAV